MQVVAEGNVSEEILEECKKSFEEFIDRGYNEYSAVACISSKYIYGVTMSRSKNDEIILSVNN